MQASDGVPPGAHPPSVQRCLLGVLAQRAARVGVVACPGVAVPRRERERERERDREIEKEREMERWSYCVFTIDHRFRHLRIKHSLGSGLFPLSICVQQGEIATRKEGWRKTRIQARDADATSDGAEMGTETEER